MRHDPRIVTRVLDLLREHGWDAGPKRLREEVERTDDPQQQEALRFFAGWNAAERGQYDEADAWFAECGLTAWPLVGHAFVALRRSGDYHFQRAEQFLRKAETEAADADPILRATVAHLRGSLAHYTNDPARALRELTAAWDLFGKDHFGSGRVLDTFGMVYAAKDNFHAAEQFFLRALACKERHGDRMGAAVTYGNLGRLYLNWEYLDRAAECFTADLKIAEATLDESGQATMFNLLGQVELARSEERAAVNDRLAAQAHRTKADAWLNESIRRAEARSWAKLAGFAYKDRARSCLLLGQVAAAEEDARKAEERFQSLASTDGLAHVQRVWGTIRREQRNQEESLRHLRWACEHFKGSGERVEQARTEWEIARALRGGAAPHPRVTAAYLEALATAEACRRPRLIEGIQRELRAVDPDALAARLFERVRGRAVRESTTSLAEGVPAPVSVLYLDLMGSTPFATKHDPAEVMLTLNQMMADFVGVLRRHEGNVSGFRGDGFLAIFRGGRHALRAVDAGLDLFRELEHFNHPRKVLDLSPFVARIGIATGEACLGNMGTYDKMDYTAIGTTANRGARVEAAAEPGVPCIDRQTHDDVGDRFVYRDKDGRMACMKGLKEDHVWDVAGRAEQKADQ
jgi:class 3 adenylate cyclase/tetratricopeptide (TPR) repeat protein